MIANKDRSGYFGASDTKFIVGNWKTATWAKWFAVKLGYQGERFENKYTLAGTYYEHAILDFYAAQKGIQIIKDEQVIFEPLKLRINYDGTTRADEIYEVKTYKNEWKPKKEYVQQLNVQMYGKDQKKAKILHYKLLEENYNNFFLDIDPARLGEEVFKRDNDFLKFYFEKLDILKNCMEKGIFPQI